MPTVIAKDAADRRRLATELMRAAGPDRRHLVRMVTAGSSAAFDVPDDVYAAFRGAQYGEQEQQQTEQPPVVSGEPLVPVGDEPTTEPAPTEQGIVEPATGDVEVPDRNDKTDVWREFMRPQLGDAVDDMTRSALIAAFDERTTTDA